MPLMGELFFSRLWVATDIDWWCLYKCSIQKENQPVFSIRKKRFAFAIKLFLRWIWPDGFILD
jgi:hypothetical protein